MIPIVARLIDEATAPVKRQATRLARTAAAGAVAGVLALVGVGFLTAAGYDGLRIVLSPALASLAVAAIFLVLAAIAFFVLKGGDGGGESTEPLHPAPLMDDAVLSVKPGIDQVADLLGRSGLAKERAALLAGNQMVRELKPTQMVLLGLVGGLVAGRRLIRGRRK